MPSQVLTTTGTSAASDRNATLAVSPRPNQTEISGIQANSEICLKVLKLGLARRLKMRDTPSAAPSSRPARVPMAKPVNSRQAGAQRAHSLPPEICSTAVASTFGRHQQRRIDQAGMGQQPP